MLTRRNILKVLVGACVAAMLMPNGFGPAAAAELSWKYFPAGPHGFFRAPVLITGQKEALLIDGGFTYADGQALAQEIKATGKTLTTIYVSQSDPDYYFSLKPVREAFPDAKVIAASETIAAIKGNVEKKLATWGPQLKENGPQSLADIILPDAFDGSSLTVDGEVVEIVPAEGLPNRRYLWVPSLKAVFGGVLVFNGTHVWTADTPTQDEQAAWVATLDAIAARNPSIVVAGHMAPDAKTDMSGVEHTKAYLLAFQEEALKAKDAAALKSAMEQRFPGLEMGVALDIGSKVAKGEMKWN